MEYKEYTLISLNFYTSFVLYYKERHIKTCAVSATSLFRYLDVDDRRELVMAFYQCMLKELENSLKFNGRELLITSDNLEDIREVLKKHYIAEELER